MLGIRTLCFTKLQTQQSKFRLLAKYSRHSLRSKFNHISLVPLTEILLIRSICVHCIHLKQLLVSCLSNLYSQANLLKLTMTLILPDSMGKFSVLVSNIPAAFDPADHSLLPTKHLVFLLLDGMTLRITVH